MEEVIIHEYITNLSVTYSYLGRKFRACPVNRTTKNVDIAFADWAFYRLTKRGRPDNRFRRRHGQLPIPVQEELRRAIRAGEV